jgi:hypothetical protein
VASLCADTRSPHPHIPGPHFVGYDIIDDGYGDMSLLTNWGTDEEGIFSAAIKNNGLLDDFVRALAIREMLRGSVFCR